MTTKPTLSRLIIYSQPEPMSLAVKKNEDLLEDFGMIVNNL